MKNNKKTVSSKAWILLFVLFGLGIAGLFGLKTIAGGEDEKSPVTDTEVVVTVDDISK